MTNTVFETVKTVHARKGFDLWVVKITQRVPKSVFLEWLEHVKSVRGWYSGYSAEGSIPGFQFRTEETALDFIRIAKKIGKPIPQQRHTDSPYKKENPEPKKKQTSSFDLAEKWQKLSESYKAESDKKYKELDGKQSNTPKRMREYNSKRVDAEILSDMAALARGIAKHYTNGTAIKEISVLQPVKSMGHLRSFVPGHDSTGYYDVCRAQSPSFIKSKTPPNIKGVNSFEQALKIYEFLLKSDDTSSNEKAEREKANRIKELEDQVRFSKIDGFFPTPKPLIKKLVNQLGIKKGDVILEPSAGMGSMLEVIAEAYPDNTLGAFEVNHTLAQLIRTKGFNCVNDDFLKFPVIADKILMNPPFENWKDIDHVQHAYNCLNPGGRLISIMGAGSFSGSTKKHMQFKEWIENVGAEYYKLPEDAFKSAFRPTGVQTYQIIIDK